MQIEGRELVMRKEFIVYEGPEYTIEWYYNERRKSPAKKYFDALTVKGSLMLLSYLKQWLR